MIMGDNEQIVVEVSCDSEGPCPYCPETIFPDKPHRHLLPLMFTHPSYCCEMTGIAYD